MPIKIINLFFKEGSSDKEYRVQIEPDGDLYAVNAYYGRRGSSLKLAPQGSGLSLDEAEKLFAKTVNKKTVKGYKVDGNADVVLGIREKTDTGLRPQLLNPIDDVTAYLHDDDYLMQQKFDGERLMIRRTGSTIVAANRKGQTTTVSQSLEQDLLTFIGDDYELDGEIVDGVMFAFDLLAYRGTDLRGKSYGDRYAVLVKVGSDNQHVHIVPTYTDQKLQHFEALRDGGAEGVVFKHRFKQYAAGRPASGGAHLKHKFWNSASCIVSGRNGVKRSIAIELYDDNGERIPAGNVTVKANQPVPEIGVVCEIKYLYVVGKGGSLYQPELLGVRSDIDPEECTTGQLVYKNGASA